MAKIIILSILWPESCKKKRLPWQVCLNISGRVSSKVEFGETRCPFSLKQIVQIVLFRLKIDGSFAATAGFKFMKAAETIKWELLSEFFASSFIDSVTSEASSFAHSPPWSCRPLNLMIRSLQVIARGLHFKSLIKSHFQ